MLFLPLMAYVCAGFTEAAEEFYYNSRSKCLETWDSCFPFSWQGWISNSSETNSTQCVAALSSVLLLSSALTPVFVFAIIFFNCNLASGPNHSFVFFYQTAPLASVYAIYLSFLVMQNLFIGNFAIVHNFAGNQQLKIDRFNAELVLFEYGKYPFIAFSIVLPLFLVKCTSCPLQKCRLPWAKVRRAVRNFREKHIGSTFIHAICSIIVLSYGDLVAISMRVFIESAIVIRSECCNNSAFTDDEFNARPCDQGDLAPLKMRYYWYFFLSLVVLLLLLSLPLSLIYYPSIPALFHKLTGRSLPRFPKLNPVFDVFQGVYKDKMRWFAGVHLLYRMILWAVFLPSSGSPFFFVIILSIHSLLQPFKNQKHNRLETLYLAALTLISFGGIFARNSGSTDLGFIIAVDSISIILVCLPALLVWVVCCYKVISKRTYCQNCILKIKRSVGHFAMKRLPQETDLKVEKEEMSYYEVEWT